MRWAALVGVVGLWAAGSAQAQTKALFVTGVASRADRTPGQGHAVGLYVTRDQGGRLAGDRTNPQGVFSLYLANVGQDVRELWVINEDGAFGASPVRVDTVSAASPEIVKTGELVLLSSQRTQYSAAEARALCRTWVETQAAKLILGLSDDEKATEALEAKATGLVNKTVNLGMSAPQLLVASIKEVREPRLKTAVERLREHLVSRERSRENDLSRP